MTRKDRLCDFVLFFGDAEGRRGEEGAPTGKVAGVVPEQKGESATPAESVVP